MSEEEKKAIETFIKKCERYDGSVEIKGISVGEEIRILDTIVKFLKELNNIKEIEKSHKEENGKLRVEYEKVYEDNLTLAQELEKEKEKNKELEEHQRQYLDGELITAKQGKFFEKIIKENYISKDKIKEKIEELEKECKQYEEMAPSARRYDGIQKIDIQINILEELLKESE